MSTPQEHENKPADSAQQLDGSAMEIDTQDSVPEPPAQDTPSAENNIATEQDGVQAKDNIEIENTENTGNTENATTEDKKDEPTPVDIEKARAEFQETARTYLIEQSRHVVIPSFAQWFDMDEIHEIEKKSFPDFFPVSSTAGTTHASTSSVYKTAETYRNTRDFIVNTYRINPVEYLTVTAVRRNLAGDVASIIRIHRFLEKWGLINYQIDPRTKPSLVGPQYTGHFQITLDTPKGLTPFVPEEVSIAKESAGPEAPASENGSAAAAFPDSEATLNASPSAPAVKSESYDESSTIPLNIDVTRNIYDETTSTKTPATVTYVCNETSNDVSEVRYHNLKSKASAGATIGPSVISKECYEQGLFPSNFSASDFVKLENASKQSEWSRQEVLLLLEGIEIFGSIENNPQSLFVNSNGQWDKISEHVSSKSRDECLVKFMHLPIEDRYLQKLVRGEEKDALNDSFSKDTIIQEVIAKLIDMPKGQEVIAENSKKNAEQSVLDQTHLVNQVIELTLEKFEAKLKFVDHLETELQKSESLLNLQRKQVLAERWLNFEKLSKFKSQNTNPELAALLDDLLTPISLSEIKESAKSSSSETISEGAVYQADEDSVEESLPVSIAEPKAYQFWSA